MGMFDIIFFKCEDCGKKIEAQSKSGERLMNEYDYICVPADVAIDANRHSPFECKCGAKYTFDETPNIKKDVRLKIIKLT